MDEAVNRLKNSFKGEIMADLASRRKNNHDTSIFELTPSLVVCPQDSGDIQNLVNWVNQNKLSHPQLSLTARAAGTDMTGGPLTESVVVDVMSHLNRIVELGPDYVVIEPGVYFRDLEKQLDEKGLMLPAYPASKDLCALGGMLANDAGGEKTLRYGKMHRYVQSLRVVFSDGQEYLVEPLNIAQLEEKIKGKSFEADLYLQLYSLITNHQGLIINSRPSVSKNSSGYNLWDVWDGTTFDLTKLLVGSQGTLGLITQAKIKLTPKEDKETLFVVFMKNLESLPQFTHEVLALSPTSLEITDDHTLKIYIKYAREMATILGVKGLLGAARLFLPEMQMLLSGVPKLVLLAEFESGDEDELAQKSAALAAIVKKFGFAGHRCQGQLEEEKYWKLRRDTFKLLREKIEGLYPAAFVDDLIVNPELLADFLPKLQAILDQAKITYAISGHLGDGNLHVIPLMDMKDPATPERIFTITEAVYDLVISYHGSLSAEHNDGLMRGPYLEKEFGREIYGLFKQIKNLFDPQNIFNPHKKTDATTSYSRAHLGAG